MVNGSQAHTASAASPPDRTSAAMRAFSSPVGARNRSIVLPGFSSSNSAISGWMVVSLTHV